MKILSIDTSCDETSAAVTEETRILSNVIWSQASLHAKWGGVYPSLAKREHEKKIGWVINQALLLSRTTLAKGIDAIAVTLGPGLAIALEVGVKSAGKLAEKHHKPLVAVNHLEAHLLSPFAQPRGAKTPIDVKYPAIGLVVSGGNTLLTKINKIGSYQTLAETQDDALGEALDKAARVLGLGYPGGAILEKLAKKGTLGKYTLTTPLASDKIKNRFSYSGLKTAFIRLFESSGDTNKQDIADLAATFQDTAFGHITNVLEYQIVGSKQEINSLVVGGGVASNTELRKRLRAVAKKHKLKVYFPFNQRLCTDNAAMIGVAAHFKAAKGEFLKNPDKLDRIPRLKL